MAKVVDPTTMWKPWIEFLKKMRYLSPSAVKGNGNIVYLNRDEEYIESVVIITDRSLAQFYNWGAFDINEILDQMKKNDIKVKGTFVWEDDQKISIVKDSNTAFTVPKVPNSGIAESDSDQYRYMNVTGKWYKRITGFIPALQDDTGWNPLTEDECYRMFQLHVTVNYTHPDNSFYVILGPDTFPLGKNASSISMKYLAKNPSQPIVYVGIREVYEDFIIYSIIGAIIV